MKKKIVLVRLFHRDKWRIGLRYDYDPDMNAHIRQVPGLTYSGTHKCWHIEDSPDTIMHILKWLGESYIVDTLQITEPYDTTLFSPPVQIPPRTRILVEPDNSQQLTAPIATGGETDNPLQKSVSAGSPDGASSLAKQSNQLLSGMSNPQTERHAPVPPKDSTNIFRDPTDSDNGLPTEDAVMRNMPVRKCRVELANVPNSNMISVKFHGFYEKEWIDEMRQYGDLEYLHNRKEWRLPQSRIAIDSLSDYFSACGLEVEVRRNVQPRGVKQKREEASGLVRERALSEEAQRAIQLLEGHLRSKRYSNSTRVTYRAMLQLFLQYFSDRHPAKITETDITAFMNDFVLDLGYSASWQSQMITAIKTYFNLINKPVRSDNIERPRKGRPLPKVLSKEEVGRILNASGNLKHRMILLMIYSCGLRRGEVSNIKLTDLDRDRNLLHIREGKGKVDRIVPLSAKVWTKIDEYMKAYTPEIYLFEGQNGGRYSVESVYNVFRGALKRAGIRKEIGVHSLRHSYATHLHENGLDIRFIQELLGHRNSRTTEIYTHVSRRNIAVIKSPIDDIDIG
jgi:integrase/recombinase XerD